jgi:PKD repeat protein
MRYVFALVPPLLISSCLIAQVSLSPNPGFDVLAPKAAHDPTDGSHHRGAVVVCLDTLTYPQQKNISGGYPGINLDAANSAIGMAQRYDVNTPVTIHGFDFFAYESEATISQVVNVTCNLYRANVSNYPQYPALATVTVPVDETFGSMTVLRKEAVFPTPVTVDFPFFLSVESNSTTSVAIYTNNYTNHSGRGEDLSAGLFGSFWYHGSNITVGSDTFDADVLINPYVEYMIEADFAKDPSCIEDNATVQLTNHSTGLFENRFFNKHAYGFPVPNSGIESYDWNYGDGTLGQNTFEGPHTYGPKGKYLISLVTEIDGWKRDCIAQKRDSIDQEPHADYAAVGFNPIQFTDQSIGSDQTIWDFGDGTVTTLKNPFYAWNTPGIYDVTLVIINACGTDSMTKSIHVYPLATTEPDNPHPIMFPNPATDMVSIRGGHTGPYTITVFNAIGEEVLPPAVVTDGALDVRQLAAGAYVMKADSPGRSYRLVFLKR